MTQVPTAPGADNVVAMFNNSNLPSHIKRTAEEVGSAASLITGAESFDSLSIRGKQFRVTRDGVEQTYPQGQPFIGVILAADPPSGMARTYYAGAYSPDDDAPPTCTSSDGIKPDDGSTKLQARSCAECPFSAWGSGIGPVGEATKGKRCSEQKRLFFVTEDDLTAAPVMLRVPATSLKSLSALGRQLANVDAAMAACVVKLTFADTEHPQVIFTASHWLSEADMAVAVGRSGSNELLNTMPSACALHTMAAALAAPTDAPQLAPPPAGAIAAPAPPEAEPVKVMTAKAGGVSYEAHIAKNWTDELLVQHGLMEIK